MQIFGSMKMLTDYQGLELLDTRFKPELKRLHTAAESLVLAMRYVGIQVRDEENLEIVLRKIAFLDEVREEIKETALGGTEKQVANLAPQWAFELSLVSEDGELDKVHEYLDSLFRCFAEACVWLDQIVQIEGHGASRAELQKTFRKLIDFVACGSLTIISGGSTDAVRMAA